MSNLVLGRFPFVHTFSLDEAASLQSTINATVEPERVDRRARFEWRANRVVLGGVGLTSSQYRAGVGARTPEVEAYSLVLGSGGRAVQQGKTALLALDRHAAMLSPKMPARFHLDSGYRGVQLTIPPHLLASTFGAMTGAHPSHIRFDAQVDLRAEGAGLKRLLDFLFAEIDRDGAALRSELVVAGMVDVLLRTLLFDLPHAQSHLLHRPVRAAEPRFLKRVEEYLAAHAADPVTVSDMARIAGVSTRSVQAAFRARHECSPTAFLRARRLELVRTRLLQARGGTVTEIALDCGFTHLGRFSSAYRRRFKESPVETLRLQARRRR